MTGPARRALPDSLSSPERRTDPFVVGLSLFLGLAAAGLVLVVLGWRSVAAQLLVAYQLPGLISGSLIGVALVAVGTSLANALRGQRDEARLRAENEQSLNEAAALLVALRGLGRR